MSLPSCFNNIIGFARTQDACVSGWNAAYAESASGLYIDELLYSLRILDSLGGKDDVWDMMERARMNGTAKFQTDIMGEILKHNQYRRENFVGEVGDRRFTTLITKDTYHGIRTFSEVRGGVFTLRGVTLNLSTTENVNLLIYNDYELLHTVAISSEAAKPKYTAITPIPLDLNGNYYFLYAPVGTPYNNKMTCGCGGFRWCFNLERPCYGTSKHNWTQWVMAAGVHGDDPANRLNWSRSEYAQGMRLHGDFKCNAMQMLCSDSSDFENNEIDKAVAWSVLYATTEFLIYEFQKSTEVSRNKLLGDETTIATGLQYCSDHYTALVNFIAEHIEPSRNDCLRCRPVLGMSKTSQRI